MSDQIRAFVPPLACDRVIGEYRFEDGSFIAIVAGGKEPTTTLLDMADKIIAIKRDELAKIASLSEDK